MEFITGSKVLKLPPGAVENIRKIHNLDKPGRIEEAISILEDWIQKQNHIIKKDFSKEYLENTLISCKGSVEKSKKQIDRLCTMKTLLPKFFLKSNVKAELQSILEIVSAVPLPKMTKDYYRVLVVKINNKNITAESFMQYYQYTVILADYLKANDYLNGLIVINDYNQLNMLDLLSKMNHSELQQFLSLLIEGYGARLKKLILLSDSKAIDLLVKIVKQFVSEKIGNRISCSRTHEDLYEDVPKDILPIEYGGKERSIEILQEEWIKELSSEKHVEYMKMINKAGTDETKRQAGTFNEEYLGMPGAFRNLSVD